MPDFFNNEIVNGLFTDPTDILFVPNGVTSLTLTSSAATFGVPLVGNGSGLTGITASSTPFTGGTVTGTTTFTGSLSATTYLGLPTDIRVTGGTYSNGTATFTNNTGGTFNVTGFSTPFTGGTVTGATTFTGGVTANTMSATTYSGNAASMTNKFAPSAHFSIKNSLTTTARYSPAGMNGTLTGINTVANRLYVTPFILSEADTITKIAAEVTTTGATSLMYIGIYELDSSYLPTGAPICVSTALSGTTIGLKEFTLSATTNLQANKWYGTAILTTVILGIRGIITPNFLGGNGGSATYGAYTASITPGYTTLPTSPTMTGVNANAYTPSNIWCTR